MSDYGECVCQRCLKRLHDHTLLELNECAMRLTLSELSKQDTKAADSKRRELYRRLAVR